MEIYIEDPDLGTLVHMYQGLADQNELLSLEKKKLFGVQVSSQGGFSSESKIVLRLILLIISFSKRHLFVVVLCRMRMRRS